MQPDRDYTHAIMTRFNLPLPEQNRIRARPGWLEERAILFERYCLPSVAAQTSGGFHWLVYFDIETPPAFRADRGLAPALPVHRLLHAALPGRGLGAVAARDPRPGRGAGDAVAPDHPL